MHRFIVFLSIVLLMLYAGETVAKGSPGISLRYVDIQQSAPSALVVDTRTLAQCQQRSIAGAHCLPAHDLIGPKGQLPNFEDIFWALGTAGIDGDETILVAGDNATQRDYVAGLLYLCGQAQVQVLRTPIKQVLRKGLRPAGGGQARGMLRQRIYHAVMRDELLVLPGEIQIARHNDGYIVPIDADNNLTGKVKLVGRIRNGRRSDIRPVRYLVHAAKLMDAIALFTRLQARVNRQGIKLSVMPVSDGIWKAGMDSVNMAETLTFATTKESNNQYAAKDRTTTLLIGLVMLSLAAMLMLVAMLPKKGGTQWT